MQCRRLPGIGELDVGYYGFANRELDFSDFRNQDERSLFLSELSAREVGLINSYSGVHDYGDNPNNLQNVSFFVSGFLLFFGGIALLCKVWWNLSFDLTSHLNTAGHVTHVMLCACLIWLGMGLLAGFELFT
jgi:hypothetical protein